MKNGKRIVVNYFVFIFFFCASPYLLAQDKNFTKSQKTFAKLEKIVGNNNTKVLNDLIFSDSFESQPVITVSDQSLSAGDFINENLLDTNNLSIPQGETILSKSLYILGANGDLLPIPLWASFDINNGILSGASELGNYNFLFQIDTDQNHYEETFNVDVVTNSPLASIDFFLDAYNWVTSATFSVLDVVDTITLEHPFSIGNIDGVEIVDQPRGFDGRIQALATIDGFNLTITINPGEFGWVELKLRGFKMNGNTKIVGNTITGHIGDFNGL